VHQILEQTEAPSPAHNADNTSLLGDLSELASALLTSSPTAAPTAAQRLHAANSSCSNANATYFPNSLPVQELAPQQQYQQQQGTAFFAAPPLQQHQQQQQQAGLSVQVNSSLNRQNGYANNSASPLPLQPQQLQQQQQQQPIQWPFDNTFAAPAAVTPVPLPVPPLAAAAVAVPTSHTGASLLGDTYSAQTAGKQQQ
jgi:hypothetical protein